MDQENNVQAALDAGEIIGQLRQAGTLHWPNEEKTGTPFLLIDKVNAGGNIVQEVVPLEGYLPTPLRTRVSADLREPDSFISYVDRFKRAGTVVFGDIDKLTFAAVLDYPEVDKPSWGSHRATLNLQKTEDWKRWEAANGKSKSQEDFAQFIEDNLINIAEPAGAQLLEMVSTLEGKKNATWSASVRLNDGSHSVSYQEDATAAAKSLTIPNAFILGVVPILGHAKYRVEARFRYRVSGSKLTMWYDLLRPEAVLQDAFDTIRLKIETGLKGSVAVLAGVAPAIA